MCSRCEDSFFSIIEITKSLNFFMNFKGNKFMVSNLHDNKEISSGIGGKGLYGLEKMKKHALAMVDNR